MDIESIKLRQVISPEQIRTRVGELAGEICRDLAGEVPVLVGVLKGAFIFLADLARAMTVPVEIDFAEISSYGSETRSNGSPRVVRDISTPIAGRHVVIVEDIIDTGLTMNRYMEELRAWKPASLRLCALVSKTDRRQCPSAIDYLGFQLDSGFLVGYGLDHNGRHRQLPGIWEICNGKKRLGDGGGNPVEDAGR